MKVSVIVPVYKAEKWLHRCVDSILVQTMEDFELLLIDDGSPDKSGEICDEYAVKDSRVRVFHKENGGVSSARNLGLDNAQGEWISFVDADDWVEVEYLAGLTENLDADMILGGVKYTSGEIHNTYNEFYDEALIGDCICKYNGNSILKSPWGNLLKRSDIIKNGLHFDLSVRYGEDTLFNKQYLLGCKSIRVISALNYNFRADEEIAYIDKYNLSLSEIDNISEKIADINNLLSQKFGREIDFWEVKNYFLSMFSKKNDVNYFYLYFELCKKYYPDMSLVDFCSDTILFPLIPSIVNLKKYCEGGKYDNVRDLFVVLNKLSVCIPWILKFKHKDFYLWYFLIKCGWWRIFDFLMKLYCRLK